MMDVKLSCIDEWISQESLPISSFSPGKLSPQGVCLSASTDEGVVRRNTMHFRVKADAFVPAGGRPNTINAGISKLPLYMLYTYSW